MLPQPRPLSALEDQPPEGDQRVRIQRNGRYQCLELAQAHRSGFRGISSVTRGILDSIKPWWRNGGKKKREYG
jgi:hypothetical protein